jgi:hypothetical protein
LHADPTARYCQACEQALVQPVIARLEVHVPQIG